MMTKDNKALVLFLESFKRELLAMADTLKTKVFKRNELENVFAFKIASDDEKIVIHDMVSGVALTKGEGLDSGQDSLTQTATTDHVSDETAGEDMGKAKTYSNDRFRSDKEAA